MSEYLMMQMMSSLGGANSSGFDIVVLITFCLVSLTYIAVPVIGYRHEPPNAFVVALYLLISMGALSLLNLIVSWVMMSDRSIMRSGMNGDNSMILILNAFAIVKSILFLIAITCFVSGIRSLRLQAPPPPSSSQLPPMAQAKSDYL